MPNLSHFHTFKINSQCSQLCEFSSVEELQASYLHNEQCYILGAGSNTVFVDDFEGKVLINKIRGINATLHSDGVRISVGAGENWHDFVAYTIEQGWGGLENLALIPGSVGAAPIQNIGAYGLEVGERIERVDVFDMNTNERFSLNQSQCHFGYRNSIFKQPESATWVIVQVHFWLPNNVATIATYGDLAAIAAPTPTAIFNKVIDIRQRKLPDPAVLGNAGSFFKNPEISKKHFSALSAQYHSMPGFEVNEQRVKVPAAWLIESAGFKGKSEKGVGSYQHQPLVLVNLDNAQGSAVISFARSIQFEVERLFAIKLEPEVRLIGRSGPILL